MNRCGNRVTSADGFTLIELLIVIAIIAILALIAIPNFLEAQTRGKISRVHSDMRTMGIALEAYFVDFNVYIPGLTHVENLFGVTRAQTTDEGAMTHYVYSRLTTPLAYLTTIPLDPFTITSGAVAGGSTDRPYRGYWYWDYQWDSATNATDRQIVQNGFNWVLRGWGPSRAGTNPWEYEILRDRSLINVYDPTNGTISTGFIMRTNKGVYPEGR